MISEVFEIKIYQDKNGKKPFVDWLESLSDKKARAKIKVRLARIRLGNLGDWKSLGEGIYELRIDEGAGYRVYFTQESNTKIVLLGGSKSTQHKDIAKARKYLEGYRRYTMEKLTEYKDYLKESLKDPEEAAEYLNAALEEGDLSLFTLALRDVVDALGGGVGETAKKSHLNRESLYRMLSKNGNPRLTSLKSVMTSLGLEVHITSKKQDYSNHTSI